MVIPRTIPLEYVRCAKELEDLRAMVQRACCSPTIRLVIRPEHFNPLKGMGSPAGRIKGTALYSKTLNVGGIYGSELTQDFERRTAAFLQHEFADTDRELKMTHAHRGA
jgi:hypothetical protein